MRTGKELMADAMKELSLTEDVFGRDGHVLMEMYFESQEEWFDSCDAFLEMLLPGLAAIKRAETPDMPYEEFVGHIIRATFHMGFLMGFQFHTEVDKEHDGVEPADAET